MSGSITTIKRFLEQCSKCGVCVEQCHHLQTSPYDTPAEVAERLLKGESSEALMDVVLECSLCGLCRQECPENLDFQQMVLEARREFLKSGITDPQQYRFLWVDYDWYLFSIYRDTYGLDGRYTRLLKSSCDILFFPGCMLSCEGPKLVESACHWLARTGDSVGLLTDCCGAPLHQIGHRDRYKAYSKKIWRSIKAKGVRQVVTACPTCHAHLIEGCNPQDGIEIISLFQLMSQEGLKAHVVGDGSVTVHDSCTDRNGEIGSSVRKLLANYRIREMRHSGANTICCGSGGIVSAVNPEVCAARAETRLMEFKDASAGTCVVYCMSCAHRLSVQADANGVRHILELVLDESVDHEKFDQQAIAMWDGEIGEQNTERLQNSELAS